MPQLEAFDKGPAEETQDRPVDLVQPADVDCPVGVSGHLRFCGLSARWRRTSANLRGTELESSVVVALTVRFPRLMLECVGITMASLALGWIGEPAFSGLVESPLARVVGPITEDVARGVSAALSFALITMLHIVFGELAPKGLALQRTEATTLWVARPIQLFEAIFRWPVALLNGVGNGVLRLAGLEPATGHERVHSVEELRLLVTGMQQAGVVEASEARIANRAFRFADVTAGELMTPRTELEPRRRLTRGDACSAPAAGGASR